MRILALAILTTIVTGCLRADPAIPDQRALCDRTERLRSDHAAALADDGKPRAVTTGRRLIATIDAGCDDAPGD